MVDEVLGVDKPPDIEISARIILVSGTVTQNGSNAPLIFLPSLYFQTFSFIHANLTLVLSSPSFPPSVAGQSQILSAMVVRSH